MENIERKYAVATTKELIELLERQSEAGSTRRGFIIEIRATPDSYNDRWLVTFDKGIAKNAK